MALTPGLLLSDRYRLTHRIAVGGMGEVWAADDTRLARQVAVKILKSELTSDPGIRRPLPGRGQDHRLAQPLRHRSGLRLRGGRLASPEARATRPSW